ncbi:MAG TPA: S8 family serine peptidase [Nocardioides sp.]|nr:S8 family serine peptidase [Nocardioides sp.]
MSARRTISIVLGVALCALSGGMTAPPPAQAAGRAMVTVLVTMDRQADLDEITGSTRQARLASLIRTLQRTATEGQQAITDRLDALAAKGVVASVDPLWVVDAVSVTATPSVAAALASRSDVATVVQDDIRIVPSATTVEPNLVATRATDVWDRGDTGEGVVIATLDSGADVTDPDLEASWRGGTDSWFDPYGEHPDAPVDMSGHGTATLGTIVGGAASGSAIGVAPGARWIAARIFNDRGTSSTTAVHEAFQWLLDPDGDPATADAPQVVNGSWSLGAGPGCDLTFQPDVQALVTAGILPVFAAGNYGAGTGAGTSVSPANYPESLAVGALADADTVLASSSRGPSACGGRTGTFPDVVAPGKDILTTDRYGLYQVVSGTSIAAPQAAGVLALTLSAHPGLTPDQQRETITASATDLGAPGPDPDTGYGRVDALAAYDRTGAAPPDYTVAVPSQVAASPGGTAAVPVTIASAHGFSGDVNLTAHVPDGWAADVSPPTVTGGSGTATVSVAIPAGAPPGDVTLTVTGTSGQLTHTASTTLSVTRGPDFSLAAPATADTVAGHTVDIPVEVAGVDGFSSAVTVTPSVPAGLTAVATPEVVSGGTGSTTVTVTVPRETTAGSYDLVISATSGGLAHRATTTITVRPAPDFAVTAPATASVAAGSSVAVAVGLSGANGFADAVTLTPAVPAGLTGVASPAVVTGGSGSSTVTVTVPRATPTGTYDLVVTATAGGLLHRVTTRVTVTAAPDFSVKSQPASASVVAGGTATYSVTVTPTSGSPGAATVTVTAPPGTTASVSPAILPGATGTSTVTITTTAATAPGSYPVAIDAVADGLHRSATSTLVVSAPRAGSLLELSTAGNANPRGLAGSADDADILSWDGAAFARSMDVSTAPWSLPSNANVDGFSRLDATRFYVSFANDTRIDGLGYVQDEDVLLFDGSRWSVWFDGTARGLVSSALDLDAISVVSGTLYFSTAGATNPPGVRGGADDADVYAWDGGSFTRVWDASTRGVPSSANVDGLDLTDATHFALSFSTSTVSLPGLGTTQDEDVVTYADGIWSTYFDGTAAGLTTEALDVDAFDIP